MRVIIAGSRHIEDYELIEYAVRKSGYSISEVVSGCARGVDTLAIRWADEHQIPVKKFPADKDFELSSSLGGFARNGDMAAYADALIAIWDGVSRGTENMIQHAQWRKLPISITIPAPGW